MIANNCFLYYTSVIDSINCGIITYILAIFGLQNDIGIYAIFW